MSKRLTRILLVSAVLFVMIALPAMESLAQSQIVMKFAHVVAPTTAKGRAAQMFADLMAQRTNNRVKVEVYPLSQLGTDREILEAMQMGTIHFNAPFTGVLPNFEPRFQVLDLPFLFEDDKDAIRVLQGKVGQLLMSYLPAKGFRGLGYWHGGMQHFTNNVRPIRTVADMRGLKMRASDSPILVAKYPKLGAVGASIPFAELYTALQQGVVDGQENTLANIFTRRFYEVQKFMTLSNHGYLGYIFLVSDRFFRGLPRDIQDTILKTAEEVNAWASQEALKEDADYLARLRPLIQITELTPQARQEFINATKSLYDDFKGVIGEELIRTLNEELKR